jgi:hypothetical protein
VLEPGALLDVFQAGTTTRISVFSDSDLSAALSNPVVANSSGVFPSVYWDNVQAVRVRVREADGTVLGDADPYYSDGLSSTDLSFTQSGTGATTRTVQAKLRDTVSPEDFGAVSVEDGASTSQSAAFLSALQSGRVVDCNGKTYLIGASVNPADGTVAGLVNGNFTRLLANQTDQDFMFNLTGQPDILVEGNSFDLGTTENAGSNNDSSRGALLLGSNDEDSATWLSGIKVRGNRVTGDGNGTGIQARGTVGLEIVYNSIVDRVVGGTPTNDAQNGIDVGWSRDALVEGNLIDGLYTRVSGTLTSIYSRGLLVTESAAARVIGNSLRNCDQAIDFSGGISADTPNGNVGCAVVANAVSDVRTWGIKFANCTRYTYCGANVIRNFGFGGIVASGQSSTWTPAAPTQATSFLTIEGNYIFDADDTNSGDCYGIWVSYRADFPGYPVGCRVLNNTIRDATGNNRLVHGILFSDGDRNVVADAPYNEVSGNRISGQTGTPTKGCVPDGVCVLTGSSPQSIANATWVPVDWDTETIDGQGMHSTSSNIERITPNGAGWYAVNASVAFTANATGVRGVRLIKNGGTVPGGDALAPAFAGLDAAINNTCIMYLAAGDNVRVEAYQSSGGALNVLRVNSQFSVRRLEQM